MTKPKFIVVHRRDENNVGDMASEPLQYFLDPEEYLTVDITKIDQAQFPDSVPVILGGGGLINNEFFGDTVRLMLMSPDYAALTDLWRQRWQLRDPRNENLHEEFLDRYQDLIKGYIDKLSKKRGPRIIWGAGHNRQLDRKNKGFDWPDWLVQFDKIGIRDYGQDLNWVPCASCMHSAFDQDYKIKNPVVWFEHKKGLVKDFGDDPIPRFTNSGNNMAQTIELLGSAETILTNSYHGAYWGTLLRRRVIVVSAWSTKFMSMRYAPAFIQEGADWKEVETKIYEDALDVCRQRTKDYWGKIKCMS
jgi:hypothetical protein